MDLQRQIVSLLQSLAPEEGYNLTALPSVRLLRSNRPLARTPVLYDPGIVIVCQGCKRGYFRGNCYIYDAQQYLAVSVPVPFTMETDASPEKPLLAIYLHLDFKLAADMILQLEEFKTSVKKVSSPESMVSSPVGAELNETVFRFLQALGTSPSAEILGPLLLRELYYHFLTGGQGNVIRSALTSKGRFGEISKVLQFIHLNYASSLNLEVLAGKARMSIPTFLSHFKHVTGITPIQYIKSVRLHQARMLMVRQSKTALDSSLAVGYESSSQFNREFKRLFGLPPGQEARRMRKEFAIPPAHDSTGFISSH